MKQVRGYKVELDLNRAQRTACLKHAGCARFAYNWGLQCKIDAYEKGEQGPDAKQLHKDLNALKQTDYPWMYEVSKCAMQEALRDLDRAFAHFFRRVKAKKAGEFKGKVGFPRFKKRSRRIGSFRLTGAICLSRSGKSIQLPRLGRLRLKERGYLPRSTHILSATVSERAGRWFVSLQVEEGIPAPQPATGEPLGVDAGINRLATCSDGRSFANPRALPKRLKKIKRLQRELARRQVGSRNRAKTKVRLARLHYRVACIRQETTHQMTSRIVAKTKPPAQRPSVVVIEDLHLAGMVKNHALALSLSDAGLGEFKRQMTYKTALAGERLVKADRFFPSSQTCCRCDHQKTDLTLADRVYHCPNCGQSMDRDLNAAITLQGLVLP